MVNDLKSDRAESKNVAAAHPDVVGRSAKIMAEARVDVAPPKEDNRKRDALLAR